MPTSLPALARNRNYDELDSMTPQSLRDLRLQCAAVADATDGNLGEMYLAMDCIDAIDQTLTQTNGATGHRIPERTRNLIRGAGYRHGDVGRPQPPTDGRVRAVVDERTGRKMPVNYGDTPWSFEDDHALPPKFSGFTSSDFLTAFSEDFAAVNLGQRPRNETLTTDTASLSIEPTVEPRIWEAIYAASVMGRLGIGTITMGAPSHTILVATRGTAPGWVAENERIPQGGGGLTAVQMHARKCGTILTLTREMLEDASNVSQALQEQLRMEMADAIDSAMLDGDGVDGAPVGLLNSSGVFRATSPGGLVYDQVVGLAFDFAEQDYPRDFSSLRLLWPPALAKAVALVKDSEGRYLQPPAEYTQIPRFTSTKIPLMGSDPNFTTSITMLDPSSILMGIRRSLRFERSDVAAVTNESTGNLESNFEHDRVSWKLTFRGDIQVVRQEFVQQLTGVAI